MGIVELETLGSELREARQRRDLTLTEVEQRIHIRARYLEALEAGQMGLLPSAVQARGFLRNYARFLGLDAELFVSRWDVALNTDGRRRGRRSVSPIGVSALPTSVTSKASIYASAEAPPGRRIGLRVLLVVTVMGVLGTFAVVGVQLTQSAQPSEISAILSPLPEATPSPSPVPTIPPRPSPLPNPNVAPAEVSLRLEVTARTWLRVIVDDIEQFRGTASPGLVLQLRGRRIAVRASNAIGLRAVVNERDMGALGARGQIFDFTFTPDNLPQPAMPVEVLPTQTGGAIG